MDKNIHEVDFHLSKHLRITLKLEWSHDDQAYLVSCDQVDNVMQPFAHGETFDEAVSQGRKASRSFLYDIVAAPAYTAESAEEDAADHRAADEALAEMARTGESPRPWAEVEAELDATHPTKAYLVEAISTDGEAWLVGCFHSKAEAGYKREDLGLAVVDWVEALNGRGDLELARARMEALDPGHDCEWWRDAYFFVNEIEIK